MYTLTPRTGALGRRLAAHLLRRCTYCPNRALIDAYAEKTAAEAVDDLLNVDAYPLLMQEPIDPKTGQPWIINDNTTPQSHEAHLRDAVRSWFLWEALHTPSIRYRMMFFMHSHFTTMLDSARSKYFFDHLLLLRYYALGNFRILAEKIVKDNLMLEFLDNTYNIKDEPNENFAREYLELYTIGKGPQIGPEDYTNYTEHDVVQAARLLTGFRADVDRNLDNTQDNGQNIDPDTGIHRGWNYIWMHDTEDKTFSHAFQNKTIAGRSSAGEMDSELAEFVDMIFAQEETSKHICRKLYRFFVGHQITTEVEQDIIVPLATTFRNENFELEPVMRQLLMSQHFYDEDHPGSPDVVIGGLVRSPLEMVLFTLSHFQVDMPDPLAEPEQHYTEFFRKSVQTEMMQKAGMNHFRPLLVAGYPAYFQEPTFNRNWFNSTTIIARYKLPDMLIKGKRVMKGDGSEDLGAQVDIVKFVKDSANISFPEDAYLLVTDLLDYLFCEESEPERINYFLNQVFLDGLPSMDWQMEWENYLNTGDDSEVRIPLENLLKAILYSPEYQLF